MQKPKMLIRCLKRKTPRMPIKPWALWALWALVSPTVSFLSLQRSFGWIDAWLELGMVGKVANVAVQKRPMRIFAPDMLRI